MSRGAWIAIGLGVVVAVFATVLVRADRTPDAISSFQECADAGNPVMESYPRQCRTPDGRQFVEDVDRTPAPSLTVTPAPVPSGEPIFCTADAFQCPDGTWVGRTGPNCEFVCPDPPTE